MAQYAEYPVTPAGQSTRAAAPAPGGNMPPAFKADFGWAGSPTPPSTAPADPHDVEFEKTPVGTYKPLSGESLPTNVVDGAPPGVFSGTPQPVWARPAPATDPHEGGFAK